MESYWGHGRDQAAFWKRVEELVPHEGQAATVQGELVRAILRLTGEYRRNGNVNWESGYDRFAAYLLEKLTDWTLFDRDALRSIHADIKAIRACGRGKLEIDCTGDDEEEDNPYARITARVMEWCRRHPVPIPHANDPKMDL